MKRVLIRCDASNLIGSGHVIRCRTLARVLHKRGVDVTFICRSQLGDLISCLEKEFCVLSLPQQELSACEGLKQRALYSAWLGCDQGCDASLTLKAIKDAGITTINWLVVDHYGIDSKWEEIVKHGLADMKIFPKLLVIDDLADRSHIADIILDQNYSCHSNTTRYKALVPRKCIQLLGPHYALLADEYAKRDLPPRKLKEVKRVLIFFGGVDRNNLTCRALEALKDSGLSHLQIDVVIGLQAIYFKQVQKLVSLLPNATLYCGLPSLAPLMAHADLCLGAGGSTTWERACLGLPTLAVAAAENQIPIAESLDKKNYQKLLGDASTVTVEMIRSAIYDYIAKPWGYKSGSSLTDGWGSYLLAFSMFGPFGKISLRLASSKDEALLLRWANDPTVRENSFSPSLIEENEHQCWFRKGLKDPNRIHLIGITAGHCPIGHIRFDRIIKDNIYAANIDISLDQSARGYGLATYFINGALDIVKNKWGKSIEIVADVLKENVASNRSFLSAGFRKDPELCPDGKNYTLYNRWRKILY